MKSDDILKEVDQLGLAERIILVEDIWDSIADEHEALGVTEDQRRELDRRLEAFRVSKDPGEPAVETIERIRAAL